MPSTWAFDPPRPLVVVFAGSQAGGSASSSANGLAAQAAGGDALTAGERSLRAAQAVRERLDDANIFTTALYNPDAALFVRAMQEGKIHLARPASPDAKERRALGKASGAVYVVWVGVGQDTSLNSAADTANNDIEMELQGIDVASGAGYSDRSRTQAGIFAAPVSPAARDSNAVQNTNGLASQQSNALLSAANTLVARLLASPLHEFARPAPPADLLPPPLAATLAPEVAAPVVSDGGDAQARADSDTKNSAAALAQAEGMIGAGDTGAAIVLLRKSVSLYPTNLFLRAALARAYGQKQRWNDAANEARRALTLISVPGLSAGAEAQAKDAQARQELTRLFSDALQKNGDANASRQAYEQIIADQPSGAASVWARLAYADLLLKQNKTSEAQMQLKAVQTIDPQNGEAATLLARLYAAQGDYKTALSTLSGSGASPQIRSRAAASLFDEAALRLAEVLGQNRSAWETGKITREGMYKATQAQASRAALLSDLLTSAPSPAPAGSPENKAYLRRVHAASVLVQAVSSLVSLLDSGDRDAGDEATLFLGEFRKEIAAAQNAAP